MPGKGVVETKGAQGGAIKKGGGMAHDSAHTSRQDSQPRPAPKPAPNPPATTPKK
jgi:hypothetical protein